MSKHFLRTSFYVINEEDKLIYKISSYETYDRCDWIHIYLELIAGQVDGEWHSANRFPEDVQGDTVIQYILKEGMEEALESNDYTILEETLGGTLRNGNRTIEIDVNII